MASVEQINREIAALERSSLAIAQELRTAYTQYLTALASAMQQQLILAAYRLCTQGYPDRFLKLSAAEQQSLQQALRQLGQQAADQLYLPLQDPSAAQQVEETVEDQADSQAEEGEDAALSNPAAIEAALDSETELETEEDEEEDEEEFELEEAIVQLQFDQPLPPEALQEWRAGAERNITIVLRMISLAANRLLYQSGILPKPIPPVLEAAAQAGMVTEGASSTPNLLNLLIEAEEQDAAQVTQIIAVRLRLAEIEYAEPALVTGRSQLRSLAARLQQLEQSYRKKQRDRSVAAAETAWRFNWFEE